MSRRRSLACALAVVLLAALTAVSGASAGSWARAARVWIAPSATLPAPAPAPAASRSARTGGVVRPRFPARRWALSATLALPPGAVLELDDGGPEAVVRLAARSDGRLAVRTARTPEPVAPAAHAAARWSHRLELTSGPRARLAVDGRPVPTGAVPPAVALRATGSAPVTATALLVTPSAAREALLLHRVGDLAARTPAHRFPFGEGDDGRLRFAGGWTSGFWPGTLWGAASLLPSGPYGSWALAASLDRTRNADALTHDLGFMFGRSVLRARAHLCRDLAVDLSALCVALRTRALEAAETLVRLAATNPAGTIPTDATSPEAETLIDSLVNLDLLTWAGRATGDPRFTQLARGHAHRVMEELQRPDGSTIQAVHFDRTTGAVLAHRTHQGVADDSTWSRGQAWAIYGFASTGWTLGDPLLVAAAERAAAWWMRSAPSGAPPPYDFSAPPGAPRDSSAAMIAAAGMLRLAGACRALAGTCAAPERWATAGSRVLDDGLAAVSVAPPLGRLGEQAYRVGPRGGVWDDRAEFLWGLDFALEAIRDRYAARSRR